MSALFPGHQFGMYGMPHGPAGLMSGSNPQPPVVPQLPGQYNTHIGAMNLGGLAGITRSSGSQQLAQYQNYMENDAELHPAASSQKATQPESGPESVFFPVPSFALLIIFITYIDSRSTLKTAVGNEPLGIRSNAVHI